MSALNWIFYTKLERKNVRFSKLRNYEIIVRVYRCNSRFECDSISWKFANESIEYQSLSAAFVTLESRFNYFVITEAREKIHWRVRGTAIYASFICNFHNSRILSVISLFSYFIFANLNEKRSTDHCTRLSRLFDFLSFSPAVQPEFTQFVNVKFANELTFHINLLRDIFRPRWVAGISWKIFPLNILNETWRVQKPKFYTFKILIFLLNNTVPTCDLVP